MFALYNDHSLSVNRCCRRLVIRIFRSICRFKVPHHVHRSTRVMLCQCRVSRRQRQVYQVGLLCNLVVRYQCYVTVVIAPVFVDTVKWNGSMRSQTIISDGRSVNF